MTTAAVIGAGIAGLAAARALHEAGARVVVYEASARPGGKIETVTIEGRPVDSGADSFLARVPHGVQLCRDLGLGDELVSPAASNAALWIGGKLRPLPDGLVLGVPASLAALRGSGILSPTGIARAAIEPLLPRTVWTDDIGVGDLIRRRFGRQVQERLVDPLLGGINAGRSEELSIEVGAAQLAAVARDHRSLMLGLRQQRRRAAAAVEGGTGGSGGPDGSGGTGEKPPPAFYSLRGGVGALVTALEADVRARGVEVRYESPVDAIADAGADVVVVAVPAAAAAKLLAPVSSEAAAVAGGIGTSSVVLSTLVYARSQFDRPPIGSGFLVPRVEGRLMTACSFGSNKWPHWAGPDEVVLRVSAGRAGDDRAMAMSDDALLGALSAELAESIGVRGQPSTAHVRRWPDGFPQLRPGHRGRMAQLAAALDRDAPGVAVAGAWTAGVGIPTCIASGQAAAAHALATTPAH